MDKNTLIGMLLMGVVIFGFMWLNQPSEAELAERQRQLDSIAAVQRQDNRQALIAGNVDTLSNEDKTLLMNVLQNLPADHASINNEGVMLSLQDGKISGTVTVADTTVTWDEVTAATSANPAAHNLR